jgi:tripartite ATP-independent transporter DctP family solute receptor
MLPVWKGSNIQREEGNMKARKISGKVSSFSVVLGVIASVFVIHLLVAGAWAGTKPKVLKLAHVLNPKHSWNIAAEGFAKDVEAETEGRIKIQVHHSGQLGNEEEEIRALLLHNLEMGLIGGDSFEAIEPKMVIEALPYAWNDHDHAYRALDGELGERLLALLLKKGIRGLAYLENGFRNVTNNVRPIHKPEDLKGIKLRTPQTPMKAKTFSALGASPVPMGWLEVYPALKQGIVDGQENPLAIIWAYKIYEVNKYLSLTGHIWSSAILVIDDMVWKTISKEDQAIMLKVAAKWRDKQRQMIKDSDAEFLDKIKAAGMQVNTVNKAPFREGVQSVWKEYESVFGKDLMDLIDKYR